MMSRQFGVTAQGVLQPGKKQTAGDGGEACLARQSVCGKPLFYIIAAAILALGAYLFCKVTGGLYSAVDNYFVSEVTAGVFDENNYCYYTNPLLCLVIKGLSQLNTSVDWFTFLAHLNLLLACGTLFYYTLSHAKWSVLEKGAIVLWLLYWVAALNLYSYNYTLWSGFFCFAGAVCLFGSADRLKPPIKNGLAFLFIFFGIALRIEVFLMSIPFFVLKYIANHFCAHNQTVTGKAWQRTFILVLVFCFIIVGCHYGARLLPENREAVRYNQARTTITDYPMKSWEEFDRKDLITQEDYKALTTWLFLDTEVLNADTLEEVARAGSIRYTVAEAVYHLIQLLLQNRRILFVPFCFLFLFGAGNIICGSWVSRLETILLFLGSGIIALFLAMKGRIPMHVLLSLIIVCSFAVLESNRPSKPKVLRTIAVLLIFACVFGIGKTAKHIEFSAPQWAVQGRRDVSDNELYRATVQDDKLFFWPNSVYGSEYYKNKGALMDREFVSHNMVDGAWTYGQPYLNNLFHALNADNPAKALLERENTYYVTEDPQFLMQLLRNHYGEDIQAKEAGILPGDYTYWSFYRESAD